MKTTTWEAQAGVLRAEVMTWETQVEVFPSVLVGVADIGLHGSGHAAGPTASKELIFPKTSGSRDAEKVSQPSTQAR